MKTAQEEEVALSAYESLVGTIMLALKLEAGTVTLLVGGDQNTHADGSRKENNRTIGTLLEYRTKAAAERAAEALRININSTTPRTSVLG